MSFNLVDGTSTNATPISLVEEDKLKEWLRSAGEIPNAWMSAMGFKARAEQCCLVPDSSGKLSRVVLGIRNQARPGLWDLAGLHQILPAGCYYLDAKLTDHSATVLATGWAIGTYRFDKYTSIEASGANLLWPGGADIDHVKRAASATFLARDLINMPACDLGPAALADSAIALSNQYKAKVRVIVGEQLLHENYPAVHAVGRAADEEPRLIDILWGDPSRPKVTLIGKGVCFDAGGYNLKSGEAMFEMKDDMGGAAQALALTKMIMDAGLPVRLRTLVPAVKNMVAGNALLPRDIIRTRKGLTVEVTNTDAEGRLVLSDALAEADSERPDLIIDYATLTDAAQIALGPDLPALFCDDDDLSSDFLRHGSTEEDPLWRLPIHRPYVEMLNSKIADLSNCSKNESAGAITAAVFLDRFVSQETKWAHIDVGAENRKDRPGRPKGGEAMGVRAAFRLIQDRFTCAPDTGR